MYIKGIEGLTGNDLKHEIDRGGKFVIYKYCISILVMTFQRPSDIYFVRGGESRVGKATPYLLLSFFLGWWGIPWGPIYTIGSFITNFGGGTDVTQEVLQSFQSEPPPIP